MPSISEIVKFFMNGEYLQNFTFWNNVCYGSIALIGLVFIYVVADALNRHLRNIT